MFELKFHPAVTVNNCQKAKSVVDWGNSEDIWKEYAAKRIE